MTSFHQIYNLGCSIAIHGCFSIFAADFLAPGSIASMFSKKSMKIGAPFCGMSFGLRRIPSLPSIREWRLTGESFGIRSKFPDERSACLKERLKREQVLSLIGVMSY